MNEVVFPRAEDGRRSGSALGRAVVADALRVVDPAAAAAAERESDWRTGYLPHFRALVEAGLDDGYDLARAGLASVHSRMRVSRGNEETSLGDVFDTATEPLETVTLHGEAKPERELILPYRGELLRGDSLLRRLDRWVEQGTIEPSCAEAVREVAAEPDWLDLSDQRLVVLGAGAEMGPLPALLAWGGTVVGIDLPRPRVWARVAATAREGAGTLIAPGATIESAGADLLTELPAVARWLLGMEGRLVLGNYVYAPGAAYPRLSAAVDALAGHVQRQRPDTALAFLATPTDVFAVPSAAVAQATARFRERPAAAKLLATLSGGRLLQPNYPPGADPGIADSLVPQQGPNYALAKRIQRWRASVARRDGTTVSFTVAPPTRTRSVTSNRLLAAAYAGAHLFGVEIFEPATSNRLMAALLVHQLRGPRRRPPGRTRRSVRRTAGSGGSPTSRGPRSGWPRSAVCRPPCAGADATVAGTRRGPRSV